MSKQYGLIIPGQQKKPVVTAASRDVSKPSIFNESSSSDDDRPQFKPRSGAQQGPSLMERRMARSVQEKALKEDPTVFRYDELYDEMESKREEEQQTKSKEPKQPKYIGRLMEVAERRKLENELRVERQVQKEREQEGEEFKDKECFVTEAYRKKLEEMRQLEAQEKRDEYLEAIGDVTKQKDLDGFYRHLYEQKLGTTKEIKKPDLPEESAETGAGDDEDVAYKPIKSGKVPPQRAYRKRRSTDDEDEKNESATATGTASKDTKKVHLSNNIDADSDFSIDSSSDEDESNAEDNVAGKEKVKGKETDTAREPNPATTKRRISATSALKKEKSDNETKKDDTENDVKSVAAEGSGVDAAADIKPKPKRDKSEIWKKRTVGEVFEAAVQRYYERRAARNA